MKHHYYLLDSNAKQEGTYDILRWPGNVILKTGHALLQTGIYTRLSNVDLLLLVKTKSARIFLLDGKVGTDVCPWKEVDLEGNFI